MNDKTRVVRNMSRIITSEGTYKARDGCVAVSFTNEGTTPVFVQSKEILPKITLTFGDENGCNYDKTDYQIVFAFPSLPNRVIMMTCLLSYE
jgi:hypothetical protein